MYDPTVRIIRSTTEDCPYTATPCMTLYFEGAPTVKQIMHTAKTLAMGHRVRPNFESRALRVYTNPVGHMVRCQVAD